MIKSLKFYLYKIFSLVLLQFSRSRRILIPRHNLFIAFRGIGIDNFFSLLAEALLFSLWPESKFGVLKCLWQIFDDS